MMSQRGIWDVRLIWRLNNDKKKLSRLEDPLMVF